MNGTTFANLAIASAPVGASLVVSASHHIIHMRVILHGGTGQGLRVREQRCIFRRMDRVTMGWMILCAHYLGCDAAVSARYYYIGDSPYRYNCIVDYRKTAKKIFVSLVSFGVFGVYLNSYIRLVPLATCLDVLSCKCWRCWSMLCTPAQSPLVHRLHL